MTVLYQHLTARLTLLGPGAINGLAFEDELARVELVREGLRGTDAAAVAAVEAGFIVGEPARLADEFRTELNER